MRRIDRITRIGFAAMAASALTFTIAVVVAGRHDLVIRNISPSLPLGWYMRVNEPVTTGSLVTFPLPRSMSAYAASEPAMQAFFRDHSLIKPVVAMSGDTICRDRRGVFSVNGKALATAARTGPTGRPLPVWRGCVELSKDEIAVFSNRVPDSIDSRLFGAVPLSDVEGVYTALWVEEGR
jgi:type IV secretory pathway protease TraF